MEGLLGFGAVYRWRLHKSLKDVRSPHYANRVRQEALKLRREGLFDEDCYPGRVKFEYGSLEAKGKRPKRDWMLLTVQTNTREIRKFPLFQNLAYKIAGIYKPQESSLDFWLRGIDTAIALVKGLNSPAQKGIQR
jgi:hypothetical protein